MQSKVALLVFVGRSAAKFNLSPFSSPTPPLLNFLLNFRLYPLTFSRRITSFSIPSRRR